MSDGKMPFNLDGVTRGAADRASELAGESPDADPRSFDSTGGGAYTVESTDYDRTEPPKDDMRTYWRQFETTPILRKPITSFASRVVEPGYYLEGDLSDEEERELDNWLRNCAILEGELSNDWRLLARKIVVQREVRGTVLIERVEERNSDDLSRFKLINPETVEVITLPDQSILMPPDGNETFEDVPMTEEGDAAAYQQDIAESEQTSWGTSITHDDHDNDNKIEFSRDEVIKITRDADIGEQFGTSRIEAVSSRIEGLKQKLDDNDEAIASKAYPLWLFKFGEPDSSTGVWDRDEIDDFMRAHEMENFHPGMKQGVRGDVNVDTISGEVAEISEYLDFDIDYVLSVMPMPKYALGSFEAGASGQMAAIAQQRDIKRQIDDARKDLEAKFTPAVQEKARDMGISDDVVDSIRLRVGDPDEPDDPTANQQVIRYLGQGQQQGRGQAGGQQGGGQQSPDGNEQPDGDEESPDRTNGETR